MAYIKHIVLLAAVSTFLAGCASPRYTEQQAYKGGSIDESFSRLETTSVQTGASGLPDYATEILSDPGKF